jgi:hypothetical protein
MKKSYALINCVAIRTEGHTKIAYKIVQITRIAALNLQHTTIQRQLGHMTVT